MKQILLLLLLIFTVNIFSQNFKHIIQYLASDSLYGRASDSANELEAAKYICKQLTKKYKCRLQQFSFKEDTVSIKYATNVVCFSKRNKKNDSTILLMAHYDGLGIGSTKSLEILTSKKNLIHNGADDNASGVAMVIELGKYLQKQRKDNIVLVFTSAHEVGLYGSEYFVNKFNIDSLKLKTVLNFDMVGRLDNTSKILSVNNNLKNLTLNNLIKDNNDLHVYTDNTNVYNTDLRYFENKNIALLNFTTGIHDDYHKHTDDENKINYNGMKLIYMYIINILEQFNSK